MDYEYDSGLGYNPEALYDHVWVYIIPDRPPILNLDNFSSLWTCCDNCEEFGDSKSATQSHVGNAAKHYLSRFPASSSESSRYSSVRSSSDPERSLSFNEYLLTAPAIGLGEIQRRRRASFDNIED
jgi:hypothetical protein